MMAKKDTGKAGAARYPDEWTWGNGLLVKAGKGKPGICTWERYQLSDEDMLSLRLTMKVWGGSVVYMTFESPEARKAYIAEESRRGTWLKAQDIAEVLCRTAPYSAEFAVFYCPAGKFGENEEVIRIYEKFS